MSTESTPKPENPFDAFSLNSASINFKAQIPNFVVSGALSCYRLVDDKMWEDFQNAQKMLVQVPAQ